MADGREESEPIALGVMLRPSGLHGHCHFKAFGGSLQSARLPLNVRIGEALESAQPAVLAEVRGSGESMTCRIRGCDDRESAEMLRGRLLFVARSDLPELRDDQFYHFELEGMEVVDSVTQKSLGVVLSVHNYPTMDAVEVQSRTGGTTLIPFSKETVVCVDRERRAVQVNSSGLEELL